MGLFGGYVQGGVWVLGEKEKLLYGMFNFEICTLLQVHGPIWAASSMVMK